MPKKKKRNKSTWIMIIIAAAILMILVYVFVIQPNSSITLAAVQASENIMPATGGVMGHAPA